MARLVTLVALSLLTPACLTLEHQYEVRASDLVRDGRIPAFRQSHPQRNVFVDAATLRGGERGSVGGGRYIVHTRVDNPHGTASLVLGLAAATAATIGFATFIGEFRTECAPPATGAADCSDWTRGDILSMAGLVTGLLGVVVLGGIATILSCWDSHPEEVEELTPALAPRP